MLRIVEEDLRGCIGTDVRYYVIDTPINETGVCRQFNTREEAEAFMKEKKESPLRAD